MLKYIIFSDKDFAILTKEKAPKFRQLSVILCQGKSLAKRVAREIADTVNGLREDNIYQCDKSDIGNAVLSKNNNDYIIHIGDQKIIISYNPDKARLISNFYDIILIGERQGKYAVQTIYDYSNYISDWYKNDSEIVYRAIADGRFGLFYNGEPLPCTLT